MSTCFLQSIKICDFKSYNGLVEISDFRQFTAVIGPNGCGKSNFMDAVGFALGESYHAFRVNNLSQLIHGSMADNPVADKCYVALEFLLEDGKTKKFRRTVTGTSRRYKYEVNESVVSSESYQVELNRIGIRDHGKSCLAFQGKIEGIAMKDPRERCAFFERMSGSVQFREEYNSFKLEMEEAEEKVQSTFEQMKILNLEVKVMSSDKKNAAIFTELKKKERDLKINLQLFHLFHAEKDIEEEMEELNKRRSQAESRWDKLKEEIPNMKRIEIQMERKIAEQESELYKHKGNLMKKEENIKTLTGNEARILKSLAFYEKNFEPHRNSIQDLKEKKKIVETELASLHSDSMSDSDSQDSPSSFDEQQFQEYSRLKLEAGKQSSVYTSQLDSKMRELQQDNDRLDNEIRKKSEIDARIQLFKDHLKKGKEREDSLKEQLDKNKYLIMEKENFRDTLLKEIFQAQKRLPELQNEKFKITETLKNARDDKYSQKRAEQKANCIKQLRDNFPGVIDRLIDLCQPKDHRYNIAFVKIFEKYSDSIVVKDAKTAKECIQFLKENKLGREMFIPLDNINPQPIKESLRDIRDPPNVKLAYDVIKFPPKIDSAVRFVTKNTLICETIQNARQLSASRETERGRKLGHTCVSLDGTMFKKYGVISGGQADLARQARKWDDNAVKQLKLRKPAVENELKAVLQKIREESRVALLNSQIEALSVSIKYIQDHLDYVMKDQGKIEEKLCSLKAEKEDISNTIQEINQIISEKERAISDIKKKIDDLDDEVFRNFCQEIGCTNIREYESKDLRIHQQKRERIQQLRDRLNTINYSLELEETRDFEGEIFKCKESLVQTRAELRKEIEEKSAILEKIEKMEENLQNERATLEMKKAEIKEARKEYRTYDLVIQESNDQINNLSKKKEWMEILRTCQIKEIKIPLHSGNLDNFDPSEAYEEARRKIEIDYSDLPEACKDRESVAEIKEILNREIDEIEGNLDRIKAPNQKAEKRLKALMEQQRQMRRKLNKEREEAKLCRDRLESVKRRRTEMFNSFMTKVSDVIENIYKRMTKSDSAQALLCAQNPEEPYLDGIIYTCIAPGKKALTMDGLSGGERSIAALALLFAIQKAKPAPFFLLDEVDAALDPENINKVVDCIREEKHSLQFIVISLKYKLFCEADVLIGVTANEGESLQSCVYVFDLQKYRKPAEHLN